MKLYISHGADRENPNWFIVEPREDPNEQVRSLVNAGRTVYELVCRRVSAGKHNQEGQRLSEYMITYRYQDGHKRRIILHAPTLFAAVDDARMTIITDPPFGSFEIIKAELQEEK